MKYLKWLILPVSAVICFVYFTLPIQAATQSVKLFIQPDVTRVDPGKEFTVEVRADINNPTGNMTYIWVTYNKTKLEFVNILDKNATFPQTYAFDADRFVYRDTNTRVVSFLASIVDVRNHPKGKNLLLFKLKFKAKSEGVTKISFSQDKTYVSNSNKNLTLVPGTVVIGNPPCPSGQVGTQPNCHTPQPTPQPQPQPTPQPQPQPQPTQPRQQPRPSVVGPSTIANRISNSYNRTPSSRTSSNNSSQQGTAQNTTSNDANNTSSPTVTNEDNSTTEEDEEDGFSSIRNIQIDPSYRDVSAVWNADNSTTSDFYYGENEQDVAKKATTTKLEGSSYQAKIDNLVPGKTYHYIITATNEGDASGDAYRRGKFTTLGYPVRLVLRNGNETVAGASISGSGFSKPVTTGDDGAVETNLAAGEHTAEIVIGETTATSNFVVQDMNFENGSRPETQEIIIDLQGKKKGTGTIVGVIITVIVFLVICAIVAFIIIKRRNASENNSYTYHPSVMIDDDFMPPAAPTQQDQYYTPMMQVDPGKYQGNQEDVPENELLR